MKIEKNFNLRTAELVDVQMPTVSTKGDLALGIKLQFFRQPTDIEMSRLSMHMTPDEALELACQLIWASRTARNR